ncbi:MAG TPA: hypothetical protein VHD56_11435 [Tepidisphaeraceae bacterium]|nr:hypothetical protein [Tepidisphaeraceae bacterium]
MPDQQTSAGDEIAPKTNVIEVRVRELSQLFNSMDPSPFLDKDLDPDAEEFIVSWANELEGDRPLGLLVHLDQPGVGAEEGSRLRDAIHTFFRHRSELSRQRLRQLLRRGRTSLLIGVLFLTGSILLGDWVVELFPERGLAEIFRESLLIGGWVSMWRPMEIFLYDWWPIRNERRVFDRLSASSVRIACRGASQAIAEKVAPSRQNAK